MITEIIEAEKEEASQENARRSAVKTERDRRRNGQLHDPH
jgi:hypothetical protein